MPQGDRNASCTYDCCTRSGLAALPCHAPLPFRVLVPVPSVLYTRAPQHCSNSKIGHHMTMQATTSHHTRLPPMYLTKIPPKYPRRRPDTLRRRAALWPTDFGRTSQQLPECYDEVSSGRSREYSSFVGRAHRAFIRGPEAHVPLRILPQALLYRRPMPAGFSLMTQPMDAKVKISLQLKQFILVREYQI